MYSIAASINASDCIDISSAFCTYLTYNYVSYLADYLPMLTDMNYSLTKSVHRPNPVCVSRLHTHSANILTPNLDYFFYRQSS